MDEQQASLQELHQIRQMMERSSRFISLSGLSGISAGLFALLGAWLAAKKISVYAHGSGLDYQTLITQLIFIAGWGIGCRICSCFYIYLSAQQKKWRFYLGCHYLPFADKPCNPFGGGCIFCIKNIANGAHFFNRSDMPFILWPGTDQCIEIHTWRNKIFGLL